MDEYSSMKAAAEVTRLALIGVRRPAHQSDRDQNQNSHASSLKKQTVIPLHAPGAVAVQAVERAARDGIHLIEVGRDVFAPQLDTQISQALHRKVIAEARLKAVSVFDSKSRAARKQRRQARRRRE